MPENKILNLCLDGIHEFSVTDFLQKSNCNIWELRSTSWLQQERDLAINIIQTLKKSSVLSMPITFDPEIIKIGLPDIVMASTYWTLEQICQAAELATENLLPCTLIVFSDKNPDVYKALLDKALQAKRAYPNLKLQIRVDWTDYSWLLSYIKANHLENEWFVDLPLCIAKKYHLITEDTIIAETFTKEAGLRPYPIIQKVQSHVKYSQCRTCGSLKTCYGCIRENYSARTFLAPLSEGLNYHPTTDLFEKDLYTIKTIITDIDSDNHSNLGFTCLRYARDKVFHNPNFINLVPLKEDYYYLHKDYGFNIIQSDPRGIKSINIPFIGADLLDQGKEFQEKLNKEYLFAKGGIIACSNIKFHPAWSLPVQEQLKHLLADIVKKILYNFGDPAQVLQKDEDIFYKTYKVATGEWKFLPGVGLSETLAIYCDPINMDYFNQLIPKKRNSVYKGITELLPELSQEKFLALLKTELENFLNENSSLCNL